MAAQTMLSPNNNSTIDENSINNSIKEESKGKKKRRKKSQMKKKNAQRKSSSSSSVGSNVAQDATGALIADGEGDTISISNNTNSSNDESVATATKSAEQISAPLVSAIAGDESPISDCQTSPLAPLSVAQRIPDLDIHFFSDTEITSSAGNGPCVGRGGAGRPSTPIQSDSELEISMREKDADIELMTNSASWKWGELPTPEMVSEAKDGAGGQTQAQRNSMLSGMFNFMKKTNKLRKHSNDGGLYLSELDAEGMDPEMAAMYFPTSTLTKDITNSALHANDDDGESGNGTSLPHSPSSMEGQKSVDSDYEDGGKQQDPKLVWFTLKGKYINY